MSLSKTSFPAGWVLKTQRYLYKASSRLKLSAPMDCSWKLHCAALEAQTDGWFPAVLSSFPSQGELGCGIEGGKLICFLHLSLFSSLDKLSTGKWQLWSWQPDTSAVPQLLGHHRTWQDFQFPSAVREFPGDPWWEHLKSTGWYNCCFHNIPQNTSSVSLWSCDLITISNVLQMYLCKPRSTRGNEYISIYHINADQAGYLFWHFNNSFFYFFFKQQLVFSSPLNYSLLH